MAANNLLLKKPANKRNDLEPAWREGEGRDGTGEWGFEVQRSALERLTSMLGIGMQNDINDIFFIGVSPLPAPLRPANASRMLDC